MLLRQLSMVGQTVTVLGLVALSYQTYQLDKNLDSAIHDRKELNAKLAADVKADIKGHVMTIIDERFDSNIQKKGDKIL